MNGCGCLRYRDGKNGIELGGMLPMCAMCCYGERCSQGEDLILELAEWIREQRGESVFQLRWLGERITNSPD